MFSGLSVVKLSLEISEGIWVLDYRKKANTNTAPEFVLCTYLLRPLETLLTC